MSNDDDELHSSIDLQENKMLPLLFSYSVGQFENNNFSTISDQLIHHQNESLLHSFL